VYEILHKKVDYVGLVLKKICMTYGIEFF